jgi:hypothetical protein
MVQKMAMQDIERLNQERQMYKTEMMKALSCRTKKQKIALAAEWREKYTPMTYDGLISLAKNHTARLKVAYWDLPDFENKRLSKHG